MRLRGRRAARSGRLGVGAGLARLGLGNRRLRPPAADGQVLVVVPVAVVRRRASNGTGGPLTHDALSGLPAPRSRLHAPASPCSCLAKNPCHRAAYDRVDAPHVSRALPAHVRAASTLHSVKQRICSRQLSGEHAAEHRREPRELHLHDRARHAILPRVAPTLGNSTPSTRPSETTPPRGSSPRGGLTRCCQREWLPSGGVEANFRGGRGSAALTCAA